MEIVIHSMGMPFNGETLATKSLGGSESCAYYQARELASRGHRVVVFTMSQEEGEWDGVRYAFCGQPTQAAPLGEQFTHYATHTPHDVLIIQRHPAGFHQRWNAKVCVLQLHDIALHRTGGMMWHGMWQVDFVTTVSEFHKNQVVDTLGLDPEFVKVVPNGVDPALYSGATFSDAVWKGYEDYELLRNELTQNMGTHLLYQSRPERGLENLLRPGGIMDQLRGSDVRLVYCGYDNTVPQMAGYYEQLDAWGRALPNVRSLGALTKAQLADVQSHADILVYPTAFEEVSCITAMEAMHAGLPLLSSEVGAMPETCRDSGTILLPLLNGEVDTAAFVEKIKELVTLKFARSPLREAQFEAAKTKTWQASVDILEAQLEAAFAKRTGNLGRSVRHCIEHSDIHLARQLAVQYAPASFDMVEQAAVDEVLRMYSFTSSSEAYAAHYLKHQTAYYDDFEDKVIGQNVTQSTRFRGTVEMLRAKLLDKPTSRILDYGCAHGHYLIPLARSAPDARFVGMDVSERAVAAATKWVMQERLSNVSLVHGGEAKLRDLATMVPYIRDEQEAVADVRGSVARALRTSTRDLFDVIIAGEVLEHVIDPMELLEAFRDLLAPDGLLVCTTPTGKWEWMGTEAFRTGREHLMQFERQDIVDLCGPNAVRLIFAPGTIDKTGEAAGSWVWAVNPIKPFEEIDWQRKAQYLAPRETISACLIVKDAEKTIRKCLESVVDYVDEIVVALDPGTKDRTADVLRDFAKDFPLKAIQVVAGTVATKDGFAAARNYSVSFASGDWVLWLDADEEVRQPWNLHRYARPSMHRAYGFPQIHYSADPATVLTTDFPCRLFRRGIGIDFHGLVHEHPEEEPGKAIKYTTIRHDVQFLHVGYVDEETRRARYRRNLPLLLRDLDDNPTRSLNKFLYLRDIAQGLMFEHEQTGGMVLESQPERARRGVDLWWSMLQGEEALPVRMLIDSLQYYSLCVATLGVGFDAQVDVDCAHPQAPDLNVKATAKARFFSKEHFTRMNERLLQEATKHYESKYL